MLNCRQRFEVLKDLNSDLTGQLEKVTVQNDKLADKFESCLTERTRKVTLFNTCRKHRLNQDDKIADLEFSLDSCRQDFDNSTTENEKCKSNLSEISENFRKSLAKNSDTESRLKNLEVKMNLCLDQKSVLIDENHNLDSEIVQKTSDLTKLGEEIQNNHQQMNRYSDEISNLQTTITNISADLTTCNDDLLDKQQYMNDLESQFQNQTRLLDRTEELYNTTKSELATTNVRFEEWVNSLQAEIINLNSEMTECSNRYQVSEERLVSLQKSHEDIVHELALENDNLVNEIHALDINGLIAIITIKIDKKSYSIISIRPITNRWKKIILVKFKI